MKCNKCWRILDREVVYISTCSHIFCDNDARKIFHGDKQCPVCETSLASRNSLTGIDLVVDDSKAVQLFGLTPKSILEITTKALEFAEFQYNLELEHTKQEAKVNAQKLSKMEKTYNDKMLEAANQINSLKHKVTSLNEEKEAALREVGELKEKCEEKERQKRKLAELYETSKNQQEINSSSFFSRSFQDLTKETDTNSSETSSSLGLKSFSRPLVTTPFNSNSAREKKDRFALLRKSSPLHSPLKSPPMVDGKSKGNLPLPDTRVITQPLLTTFSPAPSIFKKRPKTPNLWKNQTESLLSSI